MGSSRDIGNGNRVQIIKLNRLRRNVYAMVWGYISFHGVGILVVFNENLNQHSNADLIDGNLLEPVEQMFRHEQHPFEFQ